MPSTTSNGLNNASMRLSSIAAVDVAVAGEPGEPLQPVVADQALDRG